MSTVPFRESTRRSKRVRAGLPRLRYELAKVIIGQDHLIERLLIGLLTGGHLLLEGLPGLAKTLAVKTLAKAIQTDFQADSVHPGYAARRYYRHPDLQPAADHL